MAAMRGKRRSAGLLLGFALVLAGVLVGAAVADRTAAPTVTIDVTRFSGTWHEGWFAVWQRRLVHHRGRSDYLWRHVKAGSLTVAGILSDAAQLEVSLRSSSGKVLGTSTPFSAPAGRYTASLKLGRPLPGPYTVTTRVVGPGNTTVKSVQRSVIFPPPPEGVPDRASISSSQFGVSVKILHNRHSAWARFHFLTLPPRTRTVYIEWRQPDWIHICQTARGPAQHCRLPKTIDANASVYTFLRSSVPLETGRWYCQMTVKQGDDYIVARRTFVTIR
jgi:hypothetical protein